MKIEPRAYGPGVHVKMESKQHPESHFEAHRMSIEKNTDGTFNIRKEKRLKKKFENAENFHGGYRPDETGSAATIEEAMQHAGSHFGGMKAKAAGPAAEPDEDEDDDEA